jgi:hypothetical protein
MGRLSKIPVQDLPCTIQDAIYAARILGVDYLRVDALTIIQDDRTDWMEEAAKMGTYYRNSFITFVAEAGADSNSGLYQRGPPASLFGFVSGRKFTVRVDDHGFTKQPKPAYDRGWTLQETCLSRKLLVFDGTWIYWHCDAGIHYQTGFVHRPRLKSDPLVRSSPELLPENDAQPFSA